LFQLGLFLIKGLVELLLKLGNFKVVLGYFVNFGFQNVFELLNLLLELKGFLPSVFSRYFEFRPPLSLHLCEFFIKLVLNFLDSLMVYCFLLLLFFKGSHHLVVHILDGLLPAYSVS
jgi:hypothetical protein